MRPLQILYIEDKDTKFKDVKQKLTYKLKGVSIKIARAGNYEEALKRLNSRYFDFVILDLLIPQMGKVVDSSAAKYLVQYVESSNMNSRPFLIGLTEHEEVYRKEHSFFSNRLLLLEKYDEDLDVWCDNIVRMIENLLRSRSAFLNFSIESSGIDLVIFTARYESEFKPVLSQMKWLGQKPRPMKNESGVITVRGMAQVGTKEVDTVCVCMGEMGLSAASAFAAQMVYKFRPKVLAMLGMCCGFRVPKASSPSKLLDVVITSDTVCWDEGKYYDETTRGLQGFSVRSRPESVLPDVDQAVKQVTEVDRSGFNRLAKKILSKKSSKEAVAALPNETSAVPRLKYGLNVSGNCIVSRKEIIEEIVGRNPSAIGLEMEIFAVFRAVNLMDGFRPKVICIKGIADFGEEKDSDLYDPIQPVASKLSYAAFSEVFSHLDI